MSPLNSRWIPANESSRIPRTHIVVDIDTEVERLQGRDVHRFRSAACIHNRMSRRGNWWQAPEKAEFTNAGEMWQWIIQRCGKRSRTIVVAHNAGAMMRLSLSFSILPSLGMTLDGFSLATAAAWATWRGNNSTLQIVDSLSWLPTSLDNIRKALGSNLSGNYRKLPLEDGSTSFLDDDADVLNAAWLQVVDYLREADCGNWKPTGAGQGFAAFRHKHLTHKILVHDDQEVRALERRSAWTGRAEAWCFGNLTDGPFVEWDYSCAYANIAANQNVPTRLKGRIRNPSLSMVLAHSDEKSYLCRVRVRSESPTLPSLAEGRIVWGVGEFETVVWSNELQLAARQGAEIELLECWVYVCAPALKQWADWVLALIHDDTGTVPPMVKVVAKGWARSVIGRFGSRHPNWERIGDSRHDEPRLSGWSEFETGQQGKLLEVSGSAFLSMSESDTAFSVPAIMAWIMAQCRVDLWNACEAAGWENVIYVDTDSLIVNGNGTFNLHMLDLPGLRKKARYETLDVIGTRRMIQNGSLKASGVPTGSVKESRTVWSGQAWSSMAHDLASGRLDTVTVTERRLTLSDDDRRRINNGDGSSSPYRLENP